MFLIGFYITFFFFIILKLIKWLLTLVEVYERNKVLDDELIWRVLRCVKNVIDK